MSPFLGRTLAARESLRTWRLAHAGRDVEVLRIGGSRACALVVDAKTHASIVEFPTVGVASVVLYFTGFRPAHRWMGL